MFLKPVKVKRFAETRKRCGSCPFAGGQHKDNWRQLTTVENKQPDDIYHVIGVTSLKEGWSEYLGYEEGYGFRQAKSHKVYLVAKGVGRRFKVLEEDMELVEVCST